MDTKFWGPPGWKLLHSITFAYTPTQKECVRRLFESLPYVLPCKYCRASLQEYMEEDPVDDALTSKVTLSKWLWRIHNKVNDKLRGQGLLNTPNPTYESIKGLYTSESFEGWDFLFSVAENHPYCRISRQSIPMKECPEFVPLHTSLSQKNRWNVLTCEERMGKYKTFWRNLEESLPEGWRGCKINMDAVDKRLDLLRDLWRVKCCMDKEGTFDGMCKKLADHRSGCSKNKHGKTCRKKR